MTFNEATLEAAIIEITSTYTSTHAYLFKFK